MLRELNQADWQAMLGIPDARIPQALILRGTRNLRAQYEQHRRHFANIQEVGFRNGLIEDLLIGEYAGFRVAYASVYGAAMASEVTHLFGVLGTGLVVQTGCCGAWAEGVRPGDLFIPTAARCGEGAAQYYVGTRTVVAPTLEVGEFAELDPGLSVFRGGIYTTAALFAEGTREIERWAQDGWQAVDMETATTLAVAEHFGMDSAAILFVFDNPRRHTDIFTSDKETDRRRSAGNAAMVECAFRTVGQYFSDRAKQR